MGETRTPPRRTRAPVLRGLVVLVLVLLALLLAAGWYFADQLTAPPTVRPFDPDSEVVAASPQRITLETTADLATSGRFGLQLPDGRYAALGDPVEVTADRATYEVESYTGGVPSAGTPARVDEFFRVGDPSVVDLGFEEVAVDGPDGPLPSWWVEGGDEGTVVFVHGRGGTREEALRFLPSIADAGWRTLVVTYRGDEGAPAPVDGRTRFGTDAWADVEAALAWVVDEVGPDRPIAVFGTSMGGAITAQLLDRSALADEVDGVVLDSPVLSLDRTLDLQADLSGVPEVVEPALLPLAQLWADVLYGLDSATLEQTDDDGTFDLPVLLFHGAADDFVPVEQSVELAAEVDTVAYVEVPAARHVRSWNVAPREYEQALTAFLGSL